MRRKEKEKLLQELDDFIVYRAKKYTQFLGYRNKILDWEDLAQELRMTVWNAFDNFDKMIALKCFLNKVIRNAVISKLVRSKKEIDTIPFFDNFLKEEDERD